MKGVGVAVVFFWGLAHAVFGITSVGLGNFLY